MGWSGAQGRAALLAVMIGGLGVGWAAAPGVRAQAVADPYVGQSCSTTDCHDDHVEDGEVHVGFEATDCDACHVPTAGQHTFELTTPMPQLCLDCHDAPGFQPFEHAGATTCTDCHEPHVQAVRHFLRQPAPGLCLGCHTDVASEREEGRILHVPFEEGMCLDCHAPHNAASHPLLVEPLADLCISCHDDVIDADTGLRHPILERSRQCLECHSAHSASEPSMLEAETIDVCARCHDRRIPREGRAAVAAITDRIGRREHRHPPAEEGMCTECHDPHGTAGAAHLRTDAPSGLYFTPGDDGNALCFECHDEDLLSADTPLATEFRDDRTNLHAAHVDGETRDRSCRLCHEPHATAQPHLLRPDIPYGIWRLPLDWSPRPDGGSCAPGCHEDRSYSR